MAALGWLAYEIHQPLRVADPPGRLEVAPGASLNGVTRTLHERGWASLGAMLGLRLYGRAQGVAGRLQSGEYAVEAGMTARGLLSRIVDGEVIQYRLTVVEGWTFARFRRALERHEAVRATLEEVPDDQLLEALGLGGRDPEGLFFPTTYQFPRGTSDRKLLRTAYREMQERLERIWAQRQEGLPLEGPYEALILASLIEREVRVAEERRRVAGVFTRRLERGMRLQADPSVRYGLGEEHEGRLRRADLRRETPYNTYTHHGLPPTPIALPSAAALRAAVNPAEGEALYFVARGDGTHHFSATLEEHNRAVERYILGEGGAE
nr:endolytic transglycosylase MltG [Halorhodospira neutriphila]